VDGDELRTVGKEHCIDLITRINSESRDHMVMFYQIVLNKCIIIFKPVSDNIYIIFNTIV
jgi:hypothetical protein